MKKIELNKTPLLSVSIYTPERIAASMHRSLYVPITSLKILNTKLNIEDAYLFETGENGHLTRYYNEEEVHNDELFSGITYEIENQGKKFVLMEYLNKMKTDIWLLPHQNNPNVDETIFKDTLVKVLSAIYEGHKEKVPDLSDLMNC